MESKEFSIQYHMVREIADLSAEDKQLVIRARVAATKAWAPYSKFHVGAAVLLDNGIIVEGNNQENAAYPSGLCAERVTLFNAHSNHPDNIVKTLAITASFNNELVKQAIKPCGACRQVILESETRQKEKIKIILDGEDEILIFDGIERLLPFNFTSIGL